MKGGGKGRGVDDVLIADFPEEDWWVWGRDDSAESGRRKRARI